MNQYRSGEQYEYIQISGYSSDDGSCYQFSNLKQKYQLRTSTWMVVNREGQGQKNQHAKFSQISHKTMNSNTVLL